MVRGCWLDAQKANDGMIIRSWRWDVLARRRFEISRRGCCVPGKLLAVRVGCICSLAVTCTKPYFFNHSCTKPPFFIVSSEYKPSLV